VAFGNSANLPIVEEIPSEFLEKENPWVFRLLLAAPSGQIHYDVHWRAQSGIDKRQAIDAINACLNSNNNHKIAGCAYLASLWFTSPE
jgi:hypothetical protein